MSDKNWDKVKWTEFQEASFKGIDPRWEKYKEDVGARVFRNSIYQVEMTLIDCPPPFGRVVYLSLKTLDRQPRHDWREMQRIKNELVGEEVEAVEVYPAESRLVDTSNQYHLYCFPELQFENGKLPFGYKDRLVSEGSTPGINETGKGSRQRDFRKELRPKDLVRGEDLDKAAREGGFIGGQCPADYTPWVVKGQVQMSGPSGKKATFFRAECLKGKHVCFLAAKEDVNGEDLSSLDSGGDGGSAGDRSRES